MKNIQFTVIIFIIVLTSHAQNPHNGVYFGLLNTNVSIRDMVEYYDQGYYLQSLASTTSGSGSMSWNIKTDINQEILWDQFLAHNSGIARGDAVVMDSEGNKYIGGIIFFNFPDHPFVAKFNVCGDKEWCIMLPKEGFGQGVVKDIILNAKEEIILLINYTVPDSPEIRNRVFLAALNKNGEFLWESVYASPDNYPLLRQPTVEKLSYINGEYYIAGRCYYAYPNNPNHFYLTPFFVGIDSQFQEKWILPFSMEDSIRGIAHDVISLNDNILMGMVDHWLPGIEHRTTLAFFDCQGTVMGYNQILNKSLSPEYTWNIALTAAPVNDSLFVSPIGFGAFSQMNFGEIIFDTAGNVFNFNVTLQHELDSRMTKTKDGKYIVGVPVKNNSNFRSIYVYKFDQNLQSVPFDTTAYVYDSLCPYPIQSGTIDLTGCMVLTSTDWIPTPQEYYASIRTIPITIYPNPANENIIFALENTEHHRNIEIRCFNLLGVLHHQTKVQRGQQQATANVNNWPPGMYIAVVYSDGRPVGRGKFVVQ